MTVPNKLWDFLAAGVPVIVHGASECAKIVRKYGVGVVVNNLNDIKQIYGQHRKYRKKLEKIREQFLMETQADKLLNFYDRVINNIL